MTKDEALRLALEALELMYACYAHPDWVSHKQQEEKILAQCVATTMTLRQAIKAALEAKDEPVGTAGELFSNTALERLDLRPSTGIYITPPQRKPLTDEEITNLDKWLEQAPYRRVLKLVRAIEAAHGIKDNT